MRSRLAIGGLTVAVAFLLVTNPVVVDAAGQITGKQIKNSSVKGNDIKDGSLTGKDVKDGSLTGDDVDEASLAGVNATTLGGQPATAYQNTVIRVPVAATATSSGFIKQLPTAIPNGTYLVTLNVNASLSAANSGFFCSLYPFPTTGSALMASFGSNYGAGAASSINAAKVVTVTGPLALFCAGSSGTFTTPISTYNPSEITFTRLDVASSTSTVSRVGAGSGRGGRTPRP